MLENCTNCIHSSCLPLRMGWMCWKRTEGHTERLPMHLLKVEPNHWCEAFDPEPPERQTVPVDADLREADREKWVERAPMIDAHPMDEAT